VVTRRTLGPGQAIAAGGDALFSVSDLSTVWLTAEVPESSAGKVRLGAEVEVATPAYPGRLFRAKVTYVAPTLDPDTHRLPVRATIANPDGALKPDMFASFRIDSGAIGRSPAVPESAVIREGDTARVWVLGEDGALRLRPVVAGADQDGMVQIRQGVNAGERVVSKGALFVDQAGQPE
jgi:cobalt-zinc-cadmium efflux system membrane fusion protein